jgi:hypothetical protein
MKWIIKDCVLNEVEVFKNHNPKINIITFSSSVTYYLFTRIPVWCFNLLIIYKYILVTNHCTLLKLFIKLCKEQTQEQTIDVTDWVTN